MKNLLSKLIIFMVLCTSMYAKTREEILVEISQQRIPDEVFIEDFYRERIPAEYSEAFLYYTRDCPEIRMNFYSLMVVESGNFTVFRHINKNGTVDLGPSQLNSSNLKNERFVRIFTPKDKSKITSKYCYYMVMSIGYYKDLYERFGERYAFFAYNGGDKAARFIKSGETHHSRSLIKNVTRYDNIVREKIQKYSLELHEYVVNKRINHVLEIYNELAERNVWEEIEKLLNPVTKFESNDPIESFYELCLNRTPYIIRKKELFEFKSKEICIITDPEVYGFYQKLGKAHISFAI